MQPQKPKVVPLRIDDESPVMTLREAAAYLRISKTQLQKLLSGKFGEPIPRCSRPGHRILFRKAWLDEWLEESSRRRS